MNHHHNNNIFIKEFPGINNSKIFYKLLWDSLYNDLSIERYNCKHDKSSRYCMKSKHNYKDWSNSLLTLIRTKK